MHFTNEPERKPNNDRIQQWAHLEGKSESMADDLVNVAEPVKASSCTARCVLLCCLVVLFLAVIVLISFETVVGPKPDYDRPDVPALPTEPVDHLTELMLG